VGKLVLFLADGMTRDVLLDRERITIGRRADNDVCLPYPAVSGEHAQVVTILADSFLEDLASTNGTLVNGKPVTKHYLADRDQIDIGRQKLMYLADDEARVDPSRSEFARIAMMGLADKVPQATTTATPFPAHAPGGRRLDAARAAVPVGMPRPGFAAGGERPPANGYPPLADPGSRTGPLPKPPDIGTVGAPAKSVDAQGPVQVSITDPPSSPGPTVRVLSGASTGRRVAFTGAELTIGRVGVQVAVVRRLGQGFRLVPLEGSEPPRINGAPVAPDGSVLHPGDTFEVAGVRLELSTDA
jgi:predicted component of type VI protein secretion system